MTYLLLCTALILLAGGIIGLINPIMPGLPLLFTAFWLIAYIGNYRYLGSTGLIILFILTLLGMLLDFFAGYLGAKKSNASKSALIGALLGGMVGIFFALPGIIFGSAIGAMAGELLAQKDLIKTGKVGFGTFMGFIIGTVIKISLAVAMILYVIAVHIYHYYF